MASASVFAVVLNWNSAAYLEKCLAHLGSQDWAGYELLIVDNGSTDDSGRVLDDLPLPNVRRLETNLGFAGGMNVGLEAALASSAEFVWLLNVDVFVSSNCLKLLVDTMEADETLGMVAPKLLSLDGTEQHAGGRVDWHTGRHELLTSDAFGQRAASDYWLTGTAPLIRVSALRRTGLFDPNFFAYWEDVDLSSRILRNGYTLKSVPAAVATHVGGGTSVHFSPFVEYLQARNRWLFLSKNAPTGSRLARWLRVSADLQKRAALLGQLGKPAAVSDAILAGLSAAARGDFGKPQQLAQARLFERLCASHPWRASELMTVAANLIDRRESLPIAQTAR